MLTSSTIIYVTLCEFILITAKFYHRNEDCSLPCCIQRTNIFLQVNCGLNEQFLLFKNFAKSVSNLVVGECKCLKEVFKEFIAVFFTLILFNVNSNIKIKIFKTIFLSTYLKRDSRQGGEIIDWFINLQPFKSTIRKRSHLM